MRSAAVALPLLLAAASCTKGTGGLEDPLELPPERLALAFEVIPSPVSAAIPFGPIEVRLVNARGDLVITKSISVTLGLQNAATQVTTDVAFERTNDGRARFDRVVVDDEGTYRWIATAPDAATAASDEFTAIRVAGGLQFLVQPTDTELLEPIRPTVRVQLVDLSGRHVENGNADITVSWYHQGSPLETSPRVTAHTTNGVADFPDLVPMLSGNGFALHAEAANLEPVTSAGFSVTATARRLCFGTVPPASVEVGQWMEPFTVVVCDASMQRVRGIETNVLCEVETGSAHLTGAVGVPTQNGLALYDRLSYPAVETIRLIFTAPGLDSLVSGDITVLPPAAYVDRVTGANGAEVFIAQTPSLTARGDVLVFTGGSFADGLGGWTSGSHGVWRVDRTTQELDLVSVDSGGVTGNNWDSEGRISGNGRFLTWVSGSTNYASPDTNGNIHDAILRDLVSGTTEVVGLTETGSQFPLGSFFGGSSVSDDGRWVAFFAADSSMGDNSLYLRDRLLGVTTQVTHVGMGWHAALSSDGEYLAFESGSVGPGNQIFLFSRTTGIWEQVGLAPGGVQPNGESQLPKISADGNFIAFSSAASNLIWNDTNSVVDTFVYDRRSGMLERVSLRSDGAQSVPPIEPGNGAWVGGISGDGRFVVYTSYAADLVPDDTNGSIDAFVFDRRTGVVVRVSTGSDGTQGNDHVHEVTISEDGWTIAFSTSATNLSPSDTNGNVDIYVLQNPLVP